MAVLQAYGQVRTRVRVPVVCKSPEGLPELTTPFSVTLAAVIFTPYPELLLKLPQVSIALPVVLILTPSFPPPWLPSELMFVTLTLPWLVMARPVPQLYRKALMPVRVMPALPNELSSVTPAPETLLLAVMLLRVIAPMDLTDNPPPVPLLWEKLFVPVKVTAMALPAK